MVIITILVANFYVPEAVLIILYVLAYLMFTTPHFTDEETKAQSLWNLLKIIYQEVEQPDSNPGRLALKSKLLTTEIYSLPLQSTLTGSRTLRKVLFNIVFYAHFYLVV